MLENAAKVINASYSTFMDDATIWDLVVATFEREPALQVCRGSISGHHFVNELLVRHYQSERVVKYFLVRDRIGVDDEVNAFEMQVEQSRIDLVRVNGRTLAFEIKTEFDRLDNLSRQLSQYSRAFEYVIAVVHQKHAHAALDRVPEHCGVMTYLSVGPRCAFATIREPATSPYICPETQVASLSSRDLAGFLAREGLQIPPGRNERAALALSRCTPASVNHQFKESLRTKFASRWRHVQSRFHQIEPIDIQAFFHAGVDPSWIYHRRSPMV